MCTSHEAADPQVQVAPPLLEKSHQFLYIGKHPKKDIFVILQYKFQHPIKAHWGKSNAKTASTYNGSLFETQLAQFQSMP